MSVTFEGFKIVPKIVRSMQGKTGNLLDALGKSS